MITPKYNKPRRRDTGKAESKQAYEDVALRSGGVCEYCGSRRATEKHHRQFRSRGGLDLVANLIDLCKSCHGYAHSGVDAAIEGLAVSQWEDPAVRPVWYRGRSVLLLPNAPWFVEQSVPF